MKFEKFEQIIYSIICWKTIKAAYAILQLRINRKRLQQNQLKIFKNFLEHTNLTILINGLFMDMVLGISLTI